MDERKRRWTRHGNEEIEMGKCPMKTQNSSTAIARLRGLSQAVCLFLVAVLAGLAQGTTGKVEGMVVVRDAQGNLTSLSKVRSC